MRHGAAAGRPAGGPLPRPSRDDDAVRRPDGGLLRLRPGHRDNAVLHDRQGRQPARRGIHPLHRRRQLRRDDQARRLGDRGRADHDHRVARTESDNRRLHLLRRQPDQPQLSHHRRADLHRNRCRWHLCVEGRPPDHQRQHGQRGRPPRQEPDGARHQHPRRVVVDGERQLRAPQQRHGHRAPPTPRASTPTGSSATPTAST